MPFLSKSKQILFPLQAFRGRTTLLLDHRPLSTVTSWTNHLPLKRRSNDVQLNPYHQKVLDTLWMQMKRYKGLDKVMSCGELTQSLIKTFPMKRKRYV